LTSIAEYVVTVFYHRPLSQLFPHYVIDVISMSILSLCWHKLSDV